MVQPASVYHLDLPRQRIEGSEVWLPLYYHDNDTFAAVFTATYDAVAEVLPSPALVPVRWVDGRALLLVSALRYHETTWSALDGAHGRLVPYAEISVCALVTLGKAPRVLPLFADHPRAFVLDLAVTDRERHETSDGTSGSRRSSRTWPSASPPAGAPCACPRQASTSSPCLWSREGGCGAATNRWPSTAHWMVSCGRPSSRA